LHRIGSAQARVCEGELLAAALWRLEVSGRRRTVILVVALVFPAASRAVTEYVIETFFTLATKTA